MTQRLKSTINTNITNNLADNTSQDISAQDVRDIVTDINDSSPIHDITASGSHTGAFTFDLNKPVQTVTLTGAMSSMATASRDANLSKMIKILITPGASDRSVTINNNWNWLGTGPTGIFANKKALLTIVNFGSAETDIVAAFEQLSSGV